MTAFYLLIVKYTLNFKVGVDFDLFVFSESVARPRAALVAMRNELITGLGESAVT
jgi:hypothetical protein